MSLFRKQAASPKTERQFEEQQEIEFLREQVESLTLQLLAKNQAIGQIREELQYANEMLCQAVKLSECIPSDEAEECAKALLEENCPTADALAALLSVIYGCAVRPQEIESRENPFPIALEALLSLESDRCCSDNSPLNAEPANPTRVGLVRLQERVARLQATCQESAILAEKKKDFVKRMRSELQLK